MLQYLARLYQLTCYPGMSDSLRKEIRQIIQEIKNDTRTRQG